MKKPLLYFNGDSFVQGTELADHLHIQDNIGFFSYHDYYKSLLYTDPKIKNWRIPHLGKLASNDVVRDEFKLSFSNLVGEKLNVEVINHAMGGSSLDRIARSTISDLIKYKNEFTNICAFVGLTEPFRSEIPNPNLSNRNNLDMHGNKQSWIDILNSPKLFNDKHIHAIRDFKLECETNYHQLIRFYKNIILIKDFCKTNNILLYFINVFDLPTSVIVEDEYKDNTDLKNMCSYADLRCDLDFHQLIIENKHEKLLCSGGHYNFVAHEMFAKKLIEFIEKERCLDEKTTFVF
jgi:hypothetical protein